jgi:hypothetical protein
VPDGPLDLVGFDSLVDGRGQYLIRSHVISYVPSATVLHLVRSRPYNLNVPYSVLAFGAPQLSKQFVSTSSIDFAATRQLLDISGGNLAQLRSASGEVREISSELGGHSQVFVGADATEARFKSEILTQFRVIHFATHAFADVHHPERSAIVLASDSRTGDDGLLQIREIRNLKLRADLVTLSACDAGAGRSEGIQGLESLVSAFQFADARSVLASRWVTDDTFTASLMVDVYRDLGAGIAVADALRNATLTALRKFGDGARPYLWSGGLDLDTALTERLPQLIATEAFAADLTAVFARSGAKPIEIFHNSEKKIALARFLKVTLFETPEREHIFRDVLVGGRARQDGIASGDRLISINGRRPDSEDARVHAHRPVEIVLEGKSGRARTFAYPVPSSQRPQPERSVEFQRLSEDIGHVRIASWPGILGIEVARETDAAIKALKCKRLIVDLRGNFGSVGAGNLRIMSYLTPDKIPVRYSLTRRRAENVYARESLARFERIPRWTLQGLPILWKFRKLDKSILVVTEGLGSQAFHGNVVLLIYRHTVSGAEIVTHFAKEHRLGVIVGNESLDGLFRSVRCRCRMIFSSRFRLAPINPGPDLDLKAVESNQTFLVDLMTLRALVWIENSIRQCRF